MTQQKPTESDTLYWTTPAQDEAIDVLVSGGTTIDAAAAAGVNRSTVSGWRNHHPGFIAAFNTRRSELNYERADHIRDIDAKALSAVAQLIEAGDASAALTWVKARHLHAVNVAEVGLMSAGEIIDAKADEIRNHPDNAARGLSEMIDSTNYMMNRAECRDVAEQQLISLLDDVE